MFDFGVKIPYGYPLIIIYLPFIALDNLLLEFPMIICRAYRKYSMPIAADCDCMFDVAQLALVEFRMLDLKWSL